MNKASKPKIAISACLVLSGYRYDDNDKQDLFIKNTLGQYFDWSPTCPEVCSGLPVPREPMRLVFVNEQHHLIGIESGIDYSARVRCWIDNMLSQMQFANVLGFIFKSKSPCCAINSTTVYGQNGKINRYNISGLFADSVIQKFPQIPTIDEIGIHNAKIRYSFVEAVFVFRHLVRLLQDATHKRDLISFHSRFKLTAMAQDLQAYKKLGALVAKTRRDNLKECIENYCTSFLEAFKIKASRGRHENVLLHILGYFKHIISAEEKALLMSAITQFKTGEVPLIIPITLLRHYAEKYGVAYLNNQYYLNPEGDKIKLQADF